MRAQAGGGGWGRKRGRRGEEDRGGGGRGNFHNETYLQGNRIYFFLLNYFFGGNST